MFESFEPVCYDFGMKGFKLSFQELKTLRLAHKIAKRTGAHGAYRINAVILLGSGWTLKKVKNALLLNEESLRGYVEKYRQGGMEALLRTNYKGRQVNLSEAQQQQLQRELDEHIHLTTGSVIQYIKETFFVEYRLSGMRDLLHRLGYVYKNPKLVPGHPDIDAQEEFIKHDEELMMKKADDVEVLFMDAVHPEHNTMAAYGWMKRGERKELKTNSGRQRLNLHGVINAETHEVTLIESDTINKDSTLQLLELVEQRYFLSSMVYIILDNARYHYSKEVKEFLEGKKMKLVFLPPYSPNLNLIERLWRFFKKNVLYNKYHSSLKEFRKSCIDFFRNLEQHSRKISKLMNSDFELVCHKL